MKKCLMPLIVLLCMLSSCYMSQEELLASLVTPIPENEVTPTPIVVTAAPTPTPTPAPLHSELYLDGVAVEDVITYYNEVVLDAEFVTNGNPQKVQKWNSPIYYYIFGEPTDADLEQLESFCDWLNQLYGFPGIYETESQYDANLKIYFCDYDTMIHVLGDNFHGMDAGVTFWYDNDMIYDASICIRTDLSQTLRNSVILEELYNGLGPVQDTDLRMDSIIYSEFSEPQELTQIDELLLKLLYHPDIKCGMDAAECEAVIRSLYY